MYHNVMHNIYQDTNNLHNSNLWSTKFNKYCSLYASLYILQILHTCQRISNACPMHGMHLALKVQKCLLSAGKFVSLKMTALIHPVPVSYYYWTCQCYPILHYSHNRWLEQSYNINCLWLQDCLKMLYNMLAIQQISYKSLKTIEYMS